MKKKIIAFLMASLLINFPALAANTASSTSIKEATNSEPKLSSIGQEIKFFFGLSNYHQEFNFSQELKENNYLPIDSKFKEETRGFGFGYGVEFFKNHLFSTTSSLNFAHFRNDFDRTRRTPHYRVNSTALYFEQQLNLNIEFQKTIFRPFISIGNGFDYGKSSYRYYTNADDNYYIKSTLAHNFYKAGLGFTVIDKKTELFSFLKGDYYRLQRSEQKIKIEDNTHKNLVHQESTFKKRDYSKRGASYAIILGVGGLF